MATLPGLPNEVVRYIAEFLPKDDLLSLRQTSRAMNDMTFDIFRRDYFQDRYVMLEQRSIQNLIDISEHPTLRLAVRKLGLCTQRIMRCNDDVECLHDPRLENDDWENRRHPEFGGDKEEDWLDEEEVDEDECRFCGSGQLLREQEAFRFGRDQAGLLQAMRNLPNCKTLSLTDARLPWGVVRAQDVVVFPFRLLAGPSELDCGRDQDFTMYVLDTMLAAAAESKLPFKSLDINMGHRDPNRCLTTIYVQVLDSIEGLEFANLTHLRLILSPLLDYQQSSDWEPGFTRFMDMFPQLSHFTLGFEHPAHYGERQIFRRLWMVLSIPHLRAVYLSRFETIASELGGTLVRHQATLEDITFREIKLLRGNWPVLLRELWNMPKVRRITMIQCMIWENHNMPATTSMPDVVSIVDERTLSQVIGWVEVANEEMESQKLQNAMRQEERLLAGLFFQVGYEVE
ncbi:hypothetical protein BKA56DRAFT_577649 [Ilyonectria sp. MPI-CAGE-AT-0026]|nr:hypothetical protein BKA56DRAFT_577649 [Ilyonectria sp. MPI-CAGE-AT-0026]